MEHRAQRCFLTLRYHLKFLLPTGGLGSSLLPPPPPLSPPPPNSYLVLSLRIWVRWALPSSLLSVSTNENRAWTTAAIPLSLPLDFLTAPRKFLVKHKPGHMTC